MGKINLKSRPNQEKSGVIFMFYSDNYLKQNNNKYPAGELVREALENVRYNRIEVVLTKLSNEYINKVLKR